ncbi:MAG TPA: carboxylating nicotinate-nucleotide diphosphorylase [Wenzhouxiangella sp.]|nr:carboxylating nicotinate-nucleotide diphosphorylase [Wenzhouxiangella sp.]
MNRLAFLPQLEEAVTRALAEDLGARGDITSRATVPASAQASFSIVAREQGVLAGRACAQLTFARVDRNIEQRWHLDDGHALEAGALIADISGPAVGILTAERTALNFLGRLSGIATLTRSFVAATGSSGVAMAHTRKTTPGLRAAEIEAVVAGGGKRHRAGLSDAILIKDNHVATAGGIGPALERARAFAGHMVRISVEVDNLDQLGEALSAGADCILLDNFSLEHMKQAVQLAEGHRVTLEVSGNVKLERVGDIAATGVDVISVGALTHSAPCLDIGLDVAG